MYKVCILAAGKGSRNSIYSGLHKALYPINNRPAISHILDNIPKDIEIIIALGHNANQIRTYLNHVHPGRKITYVFVDNYDGLRSGPGYSLYCCRHKLQCPFIWTPVDTLLPGTTFSFPNVNWVGYKPISAKEKDKYCYVTEFGKLFYGHSPYQYIDVFIGTAGVNDYNTFWKTMETHLSDEINSEIQVLNGFNGLSNIKKINFDNWIDIGKDDKYLEIENNYIVQQKDDQVLFIDNKRVIKYFANKDIDKLIKRYSIFISSIRKINENMFMYNYIDGKMLSHIYSIEEFDDFLDELILDKECIENPTSLIKECDIMYCQKTFKRIQEFNNWDLDKIEKINGVKVDNIAILLAKIDWNSLNNEYIETFFHGDLQPENVIKCVHGFIYLDPREDFGGNEVYGDLYYELGKIEHALIINGDNINKNLFSIEIEGNEATLSFSLKSNLLSLRACLYEQCLKNNIDFHRVKLISALQFLNIASLYTKNKKYQSFLFLLGKLRLQMLLNGKDIL